MRRCVLFWFLLAPLMSTAQQAPVVQSGALVNGADFTAPATPGSFAVIFGSNLAPAGTSANASAQSTWPMTLGGTTVTLNNIAVPLAFVTPSQVNVQIPWELAGQATASLVVMTAAGSSSPVSVHLNENPVIFPISPTGNAGIFLHANNTSVSASSPAIPGEVLRMFGVGFGPVNNQPPTGSAPTGTSSITVATSVSVGGIAVQPQSTQLTPIVDSQYIGVGVGTYEVTFTVPANVTPGSSVSVTLTVGPRTSGAVTMPVQTVPVPTITSLSPSSTIVGGPAFSLTVNGTNFNSNSVVQWKGSARTTNFVSGSVLTAAITAADIATAGSAAVTVSNGGQVSSSSLFSVNVATIVAPTGMSFNAVEGNNPATQQLSLGGTSGVSFTATTSTTTGGPWLTVAPSAGVLPATLSVSVNSVNLSAGAYSGTIVINGGGATATVTVGLTMTAAAAGQLTVNPASLSVKTQLGSAVPSQSITIGNSGGGSLSWTASASSTVGNWLSISPAAGSVTLQSPSTVQVSINPQGLGAGVYNGVITINPAGLTVQVQLAISPSGGQILLEQTGVVLTGFAGSGQPPSQSIAVANLGAGNMTWTASVVRGTGISLATPTGTSVAQGPSVPSFTIQANTGGLAAGSYYGLVQVSAPGAPNSPQWLSVILNLLPSGQSVAPRVFPQGLIFVGAANGPSPAPQNVNLSTPSPATVRVTASASALTGGSWLSVNPLLAGLSPVGSLSVSANTAGMAAGTYSGTVTIVPDDGSATQTVAVALVVTNGSGIEALRVDAPRAACSPAKLVMVMRQLGSNFSSPVGWPVNLEAQVVDDCGNPALSSTVVAGFSSGDAPLALVHLGNGIYSATWKPSTASSSTVTVRASQAPLTPATVTLSGQIGVNAAPPPSVGTGGVVNAASFARGAELAPGSIVSVFGSNLGSTDGNQAGFPLPTTLANIKLTIGGIDAPIFYAGTGQVNAQIPFELTPGTQSQVTARAISSSGNELDAVPEPILIGTARPGIFTVSGSTQGAILNVGNVVVDSKTPATAGDIIVIFCTGLGATNPAAQTGQAASSGVAALQPTVTVGGKVAGLLYAGVAPGFVGLYQVNATIPPGVTVGPSVPVVITQNGVASNSATIAVK